MVWIRALCNCIPFLQPNGLAGSAKRASYKMCHGQNLHHWISNQFEEVIGVRVPTQQKNTPSLLPNTRVKYNGKFLRDHVCHNPMCIIAIIVAREAGLWLGRRQKGEGNWDSKSESYKMHILQNSLHCTVYNVIIGTCMCISAFGTCTFFPIEVYGTFVSQLQCVVDFWNVW